MQNIMNAESKKMLSEVEYPVNKQDLIKDAKNKDVGDEMLRMLNGIPDKDYMSNDELTGELNKQEM